MRRSLIILGLLLAGYQCDAQSQQPVARSLFCKPTVAPVSNGYECLPPVAITAYSELQGASNQLPVEIVFIPNADNTGASTLRISAIAGTPPSITKDVGGANVAVAASDLRSGAVYKMTFDGTRLKMTNWPGSSSGGGASTMTWVHNFPLSGSTGSSATFYPMWNLPEASGESPSLARIGGTTPNSYIYFVSEKADTGGVSLGGGSENHGGSRMVQTFSLHPNFSSATSTARVIWSSPANNTSTVRWRAKISCTVADGSAAAVRPDPNANGWTATASKDEAQAGFTDNRLQTTDLVLATTGCAAGGFTVLQVMRDTGDATSANIAIAAVSFRYTITLP